MTFNPYEYGVHEDWFDQPGPLLHASATITVDDRMPLYPSGGWILDNWERTIERRARVREIEKRQV